MDPPDKTLVTTNRVTYALDGTQRTLLVTLALRASDSEQDCPVVCDPWAQQVLDRIDHEPAALQLSSEPQRNVLLLRTRCLDIWTQDFISQNPQGVTVLHLACGLDNRCMRVSWGSSVRWIEVDFLDVINLRRQVNPVPGDEFGDSEGRQTAGGTGQGGKDYVLVAADVTQDDWLAQIPADRPTIVVFEGLTPYLDKAAGKRLVRQLVDHFPAGSQLVFDTVGPVTLALQNLIRPIKAVGGTLVWGISDPALIARQHPRLVLRDWLRPTDMDGYHDLPRSSRAALLAYRHMPWFRNLSFGLRYDF